MSWDLSLFRSIWVKAPGWCVTSSGWQRKTPRPSSSSMRLTRLQQSVLMLRLEVRTCGLFVDWVHVHWTRNILLCVLVPTFYCCCFVHIIFTNDWLFCISTAADREVQRILLELLNQMDGFDQNVNVKVSSIWMSKEDHHTHVAATSLPQCCTARTHPVLTIPPGNLLSHLSSCC